MSSMDKRGQTLRFIFDLILPRSHREFGLIDGLLRARKKKKKGVKKKKMRQRDEWKLGLNALACERCRIQIVSLTVYEVFT